MLKNTLKNFLNRIDEHLKNTKCDEQQTVNFVLSLLNGKNNSLVFSAYVYLDELRIRVSIQGAEARRFIKIPLFKLARHAYRADIHGFPKEDLEHTVEEIISNLSRKDKVPFVIRNIPTVIRFDIGSVIKFGKDKYFAGFKNGDIRFSDIDSAMLYEDERGIYNALKRKEFQSYRFTSFTFVIERVVRKMVGLR